MAVIGFALGVGAIVFAVSLRGGDETLALHPGQEAPSESKPERRSRRRPRAVGFTASDALAPAGPEPSESFTYVPVTSEGLTWRTRLTGLAGLIVLIALAAALLAGAVYQAGHIVNETIAKFLGN